MTVVSKNLKDVTSVPDNTRFTFTTVLRESEDGVSMVTPKIVRSVPEDGVISEDLDPGLVKVSYYGMSFIINVPESGTVDLWDLIAAGTPDLPALYSSAVALRGYTPTWVRTQSDPPLWRLKVIETNQFITEPVDIWDTVGLSSHIESTLQAEIPSLVDDSLTEMAPGIITADIQSRGESVIPGTTPGTVRKTWGDAVSAEFPAVVGLWDGIAGRPNITYVSRFVPANPTYQAAIQAAITEAAVKPEGIVDFEGVSYVTTGTVTVSSTGITLQNGGITPTGQFTALSVTGTDVTVRNMKFSRSTSAGYADTLAQRSCVTVNAVRFKSLNCTYLASALACLYLNHGTCDGAVIEGGRMTGASGYQNACGVYVAAGATGNKNITIRGVHIHDTTDGILLFDTSDSLVTQNRVEHLRELPHVTVTGWTNTGGNVWRARIATGNNPGVNGPATDRADGSTRMVYVNGTQIGAVAYNTTSPTANAGGIDGGYLYVNLNGTDPGTVTVTSQIVSGYAYVLYVTGAAGAQEGLTCHNRFVDNYANDVDGFGLYFQLNNNPGAIANQACGNILKSVCLSGVQDNSLPFAGLGVAGGNDTLLANNTINGVGSSGKLVPGVVVFPGAANTTARGRIVGTTVRDGISHGFEIRSQGWTLDGCQAHGNGSAGFRVYTNVSGTIIQNIVFTGCIASSNAGNGFLLDGNASGIGFISAKVNGGAAYNNTQHGVLIFGSSGGGARDCSVAGMSLSTNGAASFAQIRVRDICMRTIIDNNSMISGVTNAVGVLVDANATDTTLGTNHYTLGIPTQFNGNVNASTARARQTLTGSATLGATSDMLVFCNSGAAPTLPTAVGNYFSYVLVNRTGGSVSIATTSSQTVNGSAGPYSLAANASVKFVSDTANWRISS